MARGPSLARHSTGWLDYGVCVNYYYIWFLSLALCFFCICYVYSLFSSLASSRFFLSLDFLFVFFLSFFSRLSFVLSFSRLSFSRLSFSRLFLLYSLSLFLVFFSCIVFTHPLLVSFHFFSSYLLPGCLAISFVILAFLLFLTFLSISCSPITLFSSFPSSSYSPFLFTFSCSRLFCLVSHSYTRFLSWSPVFPLASRFLYILFFTYMISASCSRILRHVSHSHTRFFFPCVLPWDLPLTVLSPHLFSLHTHSTEAKRCFCGEKTPLPSSPSVFLPLYVKVIVRPP